MIAATLGLLVACGGGSSGNFESEEPITTIQPSHITLSLTDAPVDNATAVIVEFTGVELKPESGASVSFDFESPRQIDLLALQGENATVILEQEEVPAGRYNWVRLKVNAESNTIDSYINFEDGSQFSLYIPSGNQTGLKLNSGFNVPVGNDAAFTIDFDLRKSVVNPKGQENDYFLKPSLRIVDNVSIGSIQGTVSANLLDDESCGDGQSVYLFNEHDASIDDEGSDNSPVTSAMVTLNPDTSNYEYVIGFVLAGEYTVALTCDTDIDDAEVDEDITFLANLNVTVIANQSTEANFE